jgi:hypothetical protein
MPCFSRACVQPFATAATNASAQRWLDSKIRLRKWTRADSRGCPELIPSVGRELAGNGSRPPAQATVFVPPLSQDLGSLGLGHAKTTQKARPAQRPTSPWVGRVVFAGALPIRVSLRKDAVIRVCCPRYAVQVSTAQLELGSFSHERVHAVRRDEPAHQQILLVLRQSARRGSSAGLRRSPARSRTASSRGCAAACTGMGTATARPTAIRAAARSAVATTAARGPRLRRSAATCLESWPARSRWLRRTPRRSRSLWHARGHESIRRHGRSRFRRGALCATPASCAARRLRSAARAPAVCAATSAGVCAATSAGVCAATSASVRAAAGTGLRATTRASLRAATSSCAAMGATDARTRPTITRSVGVCGHGTAAHDRRIRESGST